MSITAKPIAICNNKEFKIRTLRVVSVCSVCGGYVNATKDDKAYRHGFKRYKKKRVDDTFSQEDAIPCSGSGKEVNYKRAKIDRKKVR